MQRIEQQNGAVQYDGWQKIVKNYQNPDVRVGIWQVINSFGGLIACWILMYFSLSISYWLTLLLSLPAAGFLVRIFIIQHDCGHNSFFPSLKANNIVGTICGVLTLTPYKYWRRSHAVHHATHADLENRGIGDIWTMTVDEYMEASRIQRIIYRIFRNPIFLFILTPLLNFAILNRIPLRSSDHYKKEDNASIWWNNLYIAAVIGVASLLIGFSNTMLIQIPVMGIAASVGTFLFYMQHQFEHTYWEHNPEWDYTLAAMEGSSYYQLPRVLQWFTGNIGFHHIHHLSPRIPNYRLEECHDDNPMFQQVVHLTFWSSLSACSLTLWDEAKDRLVTFQEAFQDAANEIPNVLMPQESNQPT